jgi:tRNA(Ile)-lysidine synthase
MSINAPTITAFTLGMAQICAALPGGLPSSIALAYSGGADSSALLHLAHAYAQQHGITLYAFHVHHGISPNADAWLAHCARTCDEMKINFAAERVTLGQSHSVEAAARHRRYAALGQMCRERAIPLLLTAHHQDDQAETVLLQLLRGAVMQKGMETVKQAPALLGTDQVWIGRPLLALPKDELVGWLMLQQGGQRITHVEDESNTDPRYARNALRSQVLPQMAQIFPGFQQVLARSAQHAQVTQSLLEDLARQDLAHYPAPRGLQMAALLELSQDRALNLLRYWLSTHGARMPSSAWLMELYTQLRTAREDAQVCVVHPDCEIHRYRGCIYWVPKWQPADAPQAFRWQGESKLDFPAFGGQLHVLPVSASPQNAGRVDNPAHEGDTPPQAGAAWGIDAAWLRAQFLQLDYRQGGERLKLAPNRPNRSLKQHCQSLDIPAWERQRLPLVRVVEEARPGAFGLLYAAGIGGNSHYFVETGERVHLHWRASA